MRVLYTNDRSAKMHLQVQLLTGTGRYQEEPLLATWARWNFRRLYPATIA